MEGAVQWATGVCLCSAVVCIVEMLLSDTAIEKTVRFVLGAMMLCAVIVPLGGIAADFSADMESMGVMPQEIPESVENQRVAFLKEKLEEMVKENLEEAGIFPVEIGIDMDIDEENSISMITAEVRLEKKQRSSAGKVREIVREKLGIEVQTVLI